MCAGNTENMFSFKLPSFVKYQILCFVWLCIYAALTVDWSKIMNNVSCESVSLTDLDKPVRR